MRHILVIRPLAGQRQARSPLSHIQYLSIEPVWPPRLRYAEVYSVQQGPRASRLNGGGHSGLWGDINTSAPDL